MIKTHHQAHTRKQEKRGNPPFFSKNQTIKAIFTIKNYRKLEKTVIA